MLGHILCKFTDNIYFNTQLKHTFNAGGIQLYTEGLDKILFVARCVIYVFISKH